MPETATSHLRSPCAIAASLDLLGDRWTLLVLRDVLLGGKKNFVDFASDESIATSVLSDRLQRLVDAGLVARVRDADDGRRRIYVPRRPALELIPILVELMAWGDAHTGGEAPLHIPPVGADRVDLVARLVSDATARVVD